MAKFHSTIFCAMLPPIAVERTFGQQPWTRAIAFIAPGARAYGIARLK
jgi:hypothetical protein